MLQAIIRQDGKYENLKLSDKLHNGFTEVTRDGDNILLVGQVIDEYIPEPSIEEKIAKIKSELAQLDLKTIRPLRAGETSRLVELEAQAELLRAELASLQ